MHNEGNGAKRHKRGTEHKEATAIRPARVFVPGVATGLVGPQPRVVMKYGNTDHGLMYIVLQCERWTDFCGHPQNCFPSFHRMTQPGSESILMEFDSHPRAWFTSEQFHDSVVPRIHETVSCEDRDWIVWARENHWPLYPSKPLLVDPLDPQYGRYTSPSLMTREAFLGLSLSDRLAAVNDKDFASLDPLDEQLVLPDGRTILHEPQAYIDDPLLLRTFLNLGVSVVEQPQHVRPHMRGSVRLTVLETLVEWEMRNAYEWQADFSSKTTEVSCTFLTCARILLSAGASVAGSGPDTLTHRALISLCNSAATLEFARAWFELCFRYNTQWDLFEPNGAGRTPLEYLAGHGTGSTKDQGMRTLLVQELFKTIQCVATDVSTVLPIKALVPVVTQYLFDSGGL